VEETVDRPAGENDRINIRLSAIRFDQESSENSGVLIAEHPTSVLVADTKEDTHDEWPFPGFSRELIGSSAGENKTLIYTFPEDAEFISLRGETAEFSITITDIKSRTLPELNDEFAQSLGEYENLDSIRQEIRESLEKRTQQEYDTNYNDQVVDESVAQSTIKYPPQMVENEIDEVIHQLERRLKSQGLDLDTYLKTRDLDNEGLREEARSVAETRVKRSLVLFKIAETEDIQVTEDELQKETDRTLESITQFAAEQDKKKILSQQMMPNLVGNIYAEMRVERTLDYLRKIAKGEMEIGSEPEKEADSSDEDVALQNES
jgi:trigger factor